MAESSETKVQLVNKVIRAFPDYPKKGIVFRWATHPWHSRRVSQSCPRLQLLWSSPPPSLSAGGGAAHVGQLLWKRKAHCGVLKLICWPKVHYVDMFKCLHPWFLREHFMDLDYKNYSDMSRGHVCASWFRSVNHQAQMVNTVQYYKLSFRHYLHFTFLQRCVNVATPLKFIVFVWAYQESSIKLHSITTSAGFREVWHLQSCP